MEGDVKLGMFVNVGGVIFFENLLVLLIDLDELLGNCFLEFLSVEKDNVIVYFIRWWKCGNLLNILEFNFFLLFWMCDFK